MPDRSLTTSIGTTVTLTERRGDKVILLDHPDAPANMRNAEAGRIVDGSFQPAVFAAWAMEPATLRAIADLIDRPATEVAPSRLDTDSRCRSCSAPIAWRLGTSGKRMPIDPVPSDNGNIHVLGSFCEVLGSDQIASAQGVGEPLYTSHFATCPDADGWRSKGGAR